MFNELRTLLSKQFRIEEEKISLESNIITDLHADSIDLMQLLLSVEDEYGITIPDETLITFKTVGDIVSYLEKSPFQKMH